MIDLVKRHNIFYGNYLSSDWKKYRKLLEKAYTYTYNAPSKEMIISLKDGIDDKVLFKIEQEIDKKEGRIDLTREDLKNEYLDDYYNSCVGKYE